MRVEFSLAPVPWSRPRIDTRSGRGFKKRELEVFQRDIARLAQSAMASVCNMRFQGPLQVELAFFLERPKSVKRAFPCVLPDIDNFAKAILDPLNGIVWNDDGQIVDLKVSKRYGSPARIVLEVCSLVWEGK